VIESNSPPAWEIQSIYPSLESAEFRQDFEETLKCVQQITELAGPVGPNAESLESIGNVQKSFLLYEQALVLASNLATYVNCILSVDATEPTARKKHSEVEDLFFKIKAAMIPFEQLKKSCDQNTFQKIFTDSRLTGQYFINEYDRRLSPHMLSQPEETLLENLTPSGHLAWANLYSDLTGQMKCQLEFSDRTETVGLAHAHALLRGADAEARRVAWFGIQKAWTEHQETASAILNSLAGWRHTVAHKRSYQKPMHFLDPALFNNRITAETLNAMTSVCRDNLPKLQKALQLMAKMLGKTKLDPWDLLGEGPQTPGKRVLTFPIGMNLVKKSFGNIHPEMAEFAEMMQKNQWIEARVMPNKAAGAHCCSFPKNGEPRVFQNYTNSMSNVVTLAHELGHAFHAWVLRDLSWSETQYTSCLAETASVFAETALRQTLHDEATSLDEKIECVWSDLESIAAYLINIPARFQFEKEFYEKRAQRTLNPNELCDLMDQAWSDWYGQNLTQNNRLFWADRLHFAVAPDSFYNFPYTFGFLFSLSIYARQKEQGPSFMPKYIEILRDTGRMTAEDLVQKHLGEDIRETKFWQKAVDVILEKIDRAELVVREL